MTEKLFLLSLIAGLVNLDKRAFFQCMISRPIVSGFIIGSFLGKPSFGLMSGVMLELLWINIIPMGAAIPEETSLSGMLAISIAIISAKPSLEGALILAIIYIIPCSKLFRLSDILLRRAGKEYAHLLERKIGENKFWLIDIMPFVYAAIIYIKGVLLFYALLKTGLFILSCLKIDPWLRPVLENAYFFLPCLGLGIVFSTFWVKPEKHALLGR